MEQFNQNTYKKPNLFQEFYHSCLGKVVILAIIMLIMAIIAIMSVPSYEKTMRETEDNIRQCLQDNDSIKGDLIDEIVMNVGRSFSATPLTHRAFVLESASSERYSLPSAIVTWY